MEEAEGENGHLPVSQDPENAKVIFDDQNLIDLNTPEHEKLRKVSHKPASHAMMTQPGSVKSSNGILQVNSASYDSLSYNLPQTTVGQADYIASNGMFTSHAESGYLTDSMTSNVSRERQTSISSELDRTPGRETGPCSSSETDTTPCGESLISFEEQVFKQKDQKAHIVDIETSLEEEHLEALARLDLSRKQDIKDNIFASSITSSSRPNVLYFDGKQTRSQSDYDVNVSHVKHAYSKGQSVDEKVSDSRKRSKSSGFPIPRVKEGVHITDDSLSKSLPHGQFMRKDTGMIEFIADDVEEMIRRSSPMSQSTCKTASSDVSSRRSSLLSLTSVESMSSTMATSMTSGMSMSYPQSPDCIPPIDPMAIYEIENQARLVADSLSHMMGNLQNNLHKMSAISVGCEEAYRTSVEVTCDSVDSSIKSMYALMAKCEELSTTMQPVYKLADQIKEIKRLLDRFETQLLDKP